MDAESVIALLSSNSPEAPAAFLSLPDKEKRDHIGEILSEGLVKAIETNFVNGTFDVVGQVCNSIKTSIPPRILKKNADAVANLVDALSRLEPGGEIIESVKQSGDEDSYREMVDALTYTTFVSVASIVSVTCKDKAAASTIVPKYMSLIDAKRTNALLWNTVTELSMEAPEAMSTRNDVLCWAVSQRQDLNVFTVACIALSNTARHNIDPVVDIMDDLVDRCDSSGENVSRLHQVLMALVAQRPDEMGPFLEVLPDLTDDTLGGVTSMSVLAKMAARPTHRGEMLVLVDRIEGEETETFASPSNVLSSTELVANVFRDSDSPEDVERAIGILLSLAEHSGSEVGMGSMAAMPLTKVRELYQRDTVPPTVVDVHRTRIERFAEGGTDQSARDAATSILAYRDGRDADALHGKVEDVSARVDEHGRKVDEVENVAEQASSKAEEATKAAAAAGEDAGIARADAKHAVETADGAAADADRASADAAAARDDAAGARDDAAAAKVAAERAEEEVRDVKAYVDERVDEMRAFLAEVAKKLPVPVMFSAESKRFGTARKLVLHFECAERDASSPCLFPGPAPQHSFVSETTAMSKWLKVALAAVRIGVSCMEQDPLGGIDALKVVWEALCQEEGASFKSFVSEPFLTSAEQDELINQLRRNHFFDQFEYWDKEGSWRCCRCHQREARERQEASAGDGAAETTGRRTEGILVEGRLLKRGKLSSLTKSWKEGLFKLNFDERVKEMQYYDPDTLTLKSSIDLDDVRTVQKVRKEIYKKEFCFSIFTAERKYYFVASDEAELDNWVSMIGYCLNEINR